MIFEEFYFKLILASSVLTMKNTSLRPGQDDDKIGVIKHSGPARPKYAPYAARITTFKEWPPALKQQPKELADAGFYYIGKFSRCVNEENLNTILKVNNFY